VHHLWYDYHIPKKKIEKIVRPMPRKKPKATLRIREARSDADYHKAYPVIRQLFPHLDMQTYARRVFVARATGYRMFFGLVNDQVVGVIGLMPTHNLHDGYVTYIEHVVVDKKHRGHGYGSELIAFAEERALEEGCNLIELDTDTGAERAAKLYEESGYQRSGYYYYKNLERGDTASNEEQ